MLKPFGYSVSIVSVLLLAMVSWKSASEQPATLIALIAGVATSIGGMGLRWASYVREQRAKKDQPPGR